jgi:hypothetical protein
MVRCVTTVSIVSRNGGNGDPRPFDECYPLEAAGVRGEDLYSPMLAGWTFPVLYQKNDRPRWAVPSTTPVARRAGDAHEARGRVGLLRHRTGFGAEAEDPAREPDRPPGDREAGRNRSKSAARPAGRDRERGLAGRTKRLCDVLLLAECPREAVDHGTYQIVEKGPLTGLDEDVRGHARGRTEVFDLVECVAFVEPHPDDKRVASRRIRLATLARTLLGNRVGRHM